MIQIEVGRSRSRRRLLWGVASTGYAFYAALAMMPAVVDFAADLAATSAA